MNIHIDINQAFSDLQTQHREGKLSREDYDRKLQTLLILTGKLPAAPPLQVRQLSNPSEISGNLAYSWEPNGQLAITILKPWTGRPRLNSFPRHVRQAARLELEDKMTDMEAAKLNAARFTDDATFEAVMDNLLCIRAEDILQKQGPATKRAINLDERFHLADNPDLLLEEDVGSLIGTGRKMPVDMER